MTKQKKNDEIEQKIEELTLDLQRTRADFENFRKRVEQDKQAALSTGESRALLKLLPVIDTLSRAIGHMPDDLKENQWAQGIAGLEKQIDKMLDGLQLKRIEATPGAAFDPELHEAIQVDEDAVGDKEVISEVLQQGYSFHGRPLRHAIVKVTRK